MLGPPTQVFGPPGDEGGSKFEEIRGWKKRIKAVKLERIWGWGAGKYIKNQEAGLNEEINIISSKG